MSRHARDVLPNSLTLRDLERSSNRLGLGGCWDVLNRRQHCIGCLLNYISHNRISQLRQSYSCNFFCSDLDERTACVFTTGIPNPPNIYNHPVNYTSQKILVLAFTSLRTSNIRINELEKCVPALFQCRYKAYRCILSRNIPYILESNPHPNLIRTSFCRFLKRKKKS